MNLHEQKTELPGEVNGLPEPDAAALAHSERLVQVIRSEINAQGGHIGFDRYMEMALYEPGLGYYSAGSRKFGRQGDFVTAPEISALFSFCLARQCRQVLSGLANGVILELGAGSGRMACDILRELQRCDSLPAGYFILETSADLRQRQRELLQEVLPDYFECIEWLERLPENPVTGVILANEVMDALPVCRVVKRGGKLNELRVACREGGFVWTEAEADQPLVSYVQHIEQCLQYTWQTGYTTEINLSMTPWIAALADTLRQGAVLLVDYGYSRREYYHPERVDGTLLCHYRHRVHADPFIYPALQDITASVDFTAAAEAAVAAGLTVAGFTSQAYFLMACGLGDMLAAYSSGDSRHDLDLAGQVKRLTLPGEMGERFKVLGLTKGTDAGMLGFTLADQRRHL